MGDEYGYSEKRKSKCDKRAKGRYARYKRGGAFRSANVNIRGKEEKKK
jgi:hypothetical protein